MGMNLAQVVRNSIKTIRGELETLEVVRRVLSDLMGESPEQDGEGEDSGPEMVVATVPRRRGPGRPRGFGRPRKPKITAPKGTRQQQGQYMGLISGLRPRQKSQVKKIRATEGPEAAIAAALAFKEQNEGPKQ